MNETAARPERIVVVGNGMVGHRLCERLVECGLHETMEIVVYGEEPRPAYDRVHLSEYFSGRGAEELALTSTGWYRDHGIELRLNQAITSIDRDRCEVVTEGGARVAYDRLVLATGSSPFVPPIKGVDLDGVFVYRTIDDLGAIRGYAKRSRRAAVIGGGLLGLEAAKALLDLGLEAHVVEFSDRLMPRQLDPIGGGFLLRAIEKLGVTVHLESSAQMIVGEHRVESLRFANPPDFPVDMVIVSAGIRPRDELARAAGLTVGERGGIQVDDALVTSDPRILAVGECALHRGSVYGLVGPGYEMADVIARRLSGEDARFSGADLSTQLKLLGVDVASFGDYFADLEGREGIHSAVVQDPISGVYQKLLLERPAAESDGESDGARIVGGILVGDTSPYMRLADATRRGSILPGRPVDWIGGVGGAGASAEVGDWDDESQVCSCNNVSKGQIAAAIAEQDLDSLDAVKACTRAGTGCGGCVPFVSQILSAELARSGREVDASLCEHFRYTRGELFQIVKLGRIESFDALLGSHGSGDGCEVCRPAVASILASSWNDLVVRHENIQDTNDRFLANIQRGGTYSVIPRVPGGEITPDKLIVLGEIAKRYDLYCKITGGQRIDLLGARVEQLPAIWEELVAAGFESGHAYGKAMRTVKSCIGSTWCRYGVQDSTAFAIRVEERYRGLRAPHKLKSAVSGCIRECAEAQNKDFGIIATENGWNLYLCGNGGSSPRHGDLVLADAPDDEVIRVIDRFLMYYIQTAKPLQRSARWLEELPGGIDTLKKVILDDSLGICSQLEADMRALVDSFHCEWRDVVESPELRRHFRHFAGSEEPDDGVHFVRERAQRRPVDWPDEAPPTPVETVPEQSWSWVRVAAVADFPENGSAAVRHGSAQIAVYRFSRRGEWYAIQNRCPHRKDNVLARGLLGDQAGEPKVACPLHKKTFSLASGKGLSDPRYSVQTFPVRVDGEDVYLKLPPAETLGAEPVACGH